MKQLDENTRQTNSDLMQKQNQTKKNRFFFSFRKICEKFISFSNVKKHNLSKTQMLGILDKKKTENQTS